MGIADLSPREIVVLAPLVILTIFFGVYPKPIFDVTRVSVAHLLEQYKAGIAIAHGMPRLRPTRPRHDRAAARTSPRLLPEFILGLGGMLMLIVGVFGKDRLATGRHGSHRVRRSRRRGRSRCCMPMRPAERVQRRLRCRRLLRVS